MGREWAGNCRWPRRSMNTAVSVATLCRTLLPLPFSTSPSTTTPVATLPLPPSARTGCWRVGSRALSDAASAPAWQSSHERQPVRVHHSIAAAEPASVGHLACIAVPVLGPVAGRAPRLPAGAEPAGPGPKRTTPPPGDPWWYILYHSYRGIVPRSRRRRCTTTYISNRAGVPHRRNLPWNPTVPCH